MPAFEEAGAALRPRKATAPQTPRKTPTLPNRPSLASARAACGAYCGLCRFGPASSRSGATGSVGGGIVNFGQGTVTIATSTISGNTAVGSGGGREQFIAGGTAYSALKQLGVGEGDTVLIHAAAGGVP